MAVDVKAPKNRRIASDGSRFTAGRIAERLRQYASRSEMGYTERYEDGAARFYQITGYMAPGKSVPLEMASHFNDEERQTAWDEWQRLEAEDFRRDMRRAAELLEGK